MLPTLSTTHYNDRRSPENDPRKQQEGQFSRQLSGALRAAVGAGKCGARRVVGGVSGRILGLPGCWLSLVT